MRDGSKKSGAEERSAGISKGRRVHVRAPSREEYADASSGVEPSAPTTPPSTPAVPPTLTPSKPAAKDSPPAKRIKKKNAEGVTRKR